MMKSVMERWKPDFVIIGAAKAATTWLQVQLQQSPAIYMPDPEPHFFTREYDLGEASYRQWFADASPLARTIGEKSADYLADPMVPERLHRMLPNARLVVQLRDPVERAYSDYKMLYRRGTVGSDPARYLSTPDNDQPRFLEDGLYGRHLARWLSHFPREQLLVFRFQDVRHRPEDIVRQVFEHIGAGDHTVAPLVSRKENNSRERILPLPVRNALAPFKERARPMRGKRWFEGVRSLLAREITYPPLTADLRRRMEDFYAADIAQTEQLLRMDLSDWHPGTRRSAA